MGKNVLPDDSLPEDVDIKETRNKSESTNKESLGYIVITELPGDEDEPFKNGTSDSKSIEPIDEIGKTPEVLHFLMKASCDNIQHLDTNREGETLNESTDCANSPSKDVITEPRAKSEEPTKKRRFSIDSSYSRKSLFGLNIFKKMKEATTKIKDSKLSIPKYLNKDCSRKDQNAVVSIDSAFVAHKKEMAGKSNQTKPVYINIPLKPPDGQTDEFSYLEFEEKKPNLTFEVENQGDVQSEEGKDNVKSGEKTLPLDIQIPSSKVIGDKGESECPDEIVAIEILKAESFDLENAVKNGFAKENLEEGEIYIIQQDLTSNTNEDVIGIIMPRKETSESILTEELPLKRHKSTGCSRKVRAKSAEPERKRKLSIDSSYSRISLSKLGLLKKLRDAKEWIKLPKPLLGKSNSMVVKLEKKDEVAENKNNPRKSNKKDEKDVDVFKDEKPHYIHIPLKPPQGLTDEFSYLEFQNKTFLPPTPLKEEQSSIESPASIKGDGVQFIFLTPPSDDEILDSNSEIPETPSSESTTFFTPARICELKTIAKTAVDKYSSQPLNKLEAVYEGNSYDKITDDTKNDTKVDLILDSKYVIHDQILERMVVDEEDGLKLTESAMAKQEQNIKSKEIEEYEKTDLKSSLKGEGSPILKKKVSFKRKSRDETEKRKDEEIALAEKVEKWKEKDLSQVETVVLKPISLKSLAEDESHLDNENIKSTSVVEYPNRWSKLR